MRQSPITIEAARRQRAGARALWSRTAVAGLRRPPSAGCAAHDAGHRSHSLRRVRAGRHRLYLVAERPAAGDGLAAPRREWTCAGARPPSARCFSNRPLSPGLRAWIRVLAEMRDIEPGDKPVGTRAALRREARERPPLARYCGWPDGQCATPHRRSAAPLSERAPAAASATTSTRKAHRVHHQRSRPVQARARTAATRQDRASGAHNLQALTTRSLCRRIGPRLNKKLFVIRPLFLLTRAPNGGDWQLSALIQNQSHGLCFRNPTSENSRRCEIPSPRRAESQPAHSRHV